MTESPPGGGPVLLPPPFPLLLQDVPHYCPRLLSTSTRLPTVAALAHRRVWRVGTFEHTVQYCFRRSPKYCGVYNNPFQCGYSGLFAPAMISDDGEQDLRKFYDSIANHDSNPRARRHRRASGMIQSIPQRHMPQSHRNSYLEISPLRVYPIHLPSSTLQLRPVFTEQLSDWPPNLSEIDPFAPSVVLEPPRKEGVFRAAPTVVTQRQRQQQQKAPISIAPSRVASSKKTHTGSPICNTLPLPKSLEPDFSPILLPSSGDIAASSLLPVIGEDLQSVPFGSLFINHLTVVCFIRHFYCPMCSDYMISLVATANPDTLREANVDLVIISDGSPKMIATYRKIFKCPFPIFTDPTRNLYRVLGMTLRTLDAGPPKEAGDYIIHGSLGGLGMVLRNAVKLPLANAGDIKQLGGEFLLGPGPVCHYAHRMHTTRSHAPVRDLLEHAGVDMNLIPKDTQHLVDVREEERWKMERERKMREIRNAKFARRGYISWTDECTSSDLTGESFCDIV